MNRNDSQIPVIDISNGNDQTADDLVDAATRYGFVFIKSKGLGFSAEIVDRMFELSQKFFRSPVEEKEPCRIGVENVGWSPMHSELLDPGNQKIGDFKEAYNFKRTSAGTLIHPLPKSLQPSETEINEFFSLCHDLCLKVLELFALGLKIDPSKGGSSWFASRHDPKADSGTVLRILHYPSTSSPQDSLRCGAHSDYGSVTLLFRLPGQPGLEILNQDNTWSSVPVTPPSTENDPFPPILVNIGDLLSYWTGGLLRSTVHRVVYPEDHKKTTAGKGDRYSIAYFCHPNRETELVEVPSEVVKEKLGMLGGRGKVGAKVMTASEHLQSRLAATYGWQKGEERVAAAS